VSPESNTDNRTEIRRRLREMEGGARALEPCADLRELVGRQRANACAARVGQLHALAGIAQHLKKPVSAIAAGIDANPFQLHKAKVVGLYVRASGYIGGVF
jgi:hypothetical protein